jgi:DNA-binding GntR family transcriptional regulator
MKPRRTVLSLSALEPVSVRDKVVAVLKDAFFAGTLKPGDPIVERHLARDLRVGTPPVREALVVLQEQGFVRRVANTATYVTKFSPEDVRQAYALRIELELLAFQWARPRVTAADLEDLASRVDRLVDAAAARETRRFLELDLAFHARCWELSGNRYLADTLRRHMTPLSVFVVLGSGIVPDVSMAREHYVLVNALRHLEEPEFSRTIRQALSAFESHWPSVWVADADGTPDPSLPAELQPTGTRPE